MRERPDASADKTMKVAQSSRSDREKFEKLGLCDLETQVLGIFDDVFKDHSIDVRTGELLGRYIAEEHDSARLLRSCYEQLAGGAGDTATQSELAALNAKVDALCAAVEQLQQSVVGAATASNGRSRSKSPARATAADSVDHMYGDELLTVPATCSARSRLPF